MTRVEEEMSGMYTRFLLVCRKGGIGEMNDLLATKTAWGQSSSLSAALPILSTFSPWPASSDDEVPCTAVQ
jgi:hypothetical protein